MRELVIISVLIGCCFGVNIGVNIALTRAYEEPKTPTAGRDASSSCTDRAKD